MFAVVRHPATAGLGTCSADAMDIHRANGWVRVSEYRAAPGDFHLPDFADAPDLDAEPEPDPEPQPDEKPAAKTTKEKQA
jgi:hypothetical protein